MKNNFNKVLFLMILVFVFLFMLGGNRLFMPHAEMRKDFSYLALFSEIVALVKTGYVEEVNPQQKFPGAFSGMLGSLDPYSAYLDPHLTERFQAYLSGQYCSVGVYGAKAFGYFLITGLDPDSPALHADLKPGNIIKAVNGKSFYSLSYWEMHLSLISLTPTPLELTMFKENRQDTYKIKTATTPVQHHISSQTVASKYLLIHLSRFDAAAMTELKTILSSKKEISGLILDLRRGSGGDMSSFLDIATLLVPCTVNLTLKYKNNTKTFLVGSPQAPIYPRAVIIDRSTRLYSELLARILVEAKNSQKTSILFAGARTNGFMVQLSPIPLEDGSSILITEAHFFLNGKKLAGAGISPDVIIPETNTGDIVNTCISRLSDSSPKK